MMAEVAARQGVSSGGVKAVVKGILSFLKHAGWRSIDSL